MLFKSLQSISNVNSVSQKSQLNYTRVSSQFGSNSIQLLAVDACIDINLAPLLTAHIDANIRV
ncbi:hypothetical protein RB653_001558 [Dictyostelium firmibasis]|uniref:Uncharacterized protein n=1 Tax=Dictyostelium firmibasis TaxID=79012 RepID=A0AAN7UGX1_9MYCE